jgi:hypothetical protein
VSLNVHREDQTVLCSIFRYAKEFSILQRLRFNHPNGRTECTELGLTIAPPIALSMDRVGGSRTQ